MLLSSIYEKLGRELVKVRTINLAGTGQEAITELMSLNLNGILWINPGQPHYKTIKQLDKAGFPLTVISIGRVETFRNMLGLSFRDEGYAAAKYLFELGHEKILVSGDSFKEQSTADLLDGFKKAHADYKKLSMKN